MKSLPEPELLPADEQPKAEPRQDFYADEGGSKLAKRLNAREVVQEFAQACEEIRQGFALVERARIRLSSAFPEEQNVHIMDKYNRTPSWDNPRDVIAEVERQCWRGVVDRLGLWGVLSPTRADELRQMLEHGRMPALTEEAITSMAASFRGQLDTLIQECVREAYDYLRPRAEMFRRHKSNHVEQVGRKVVLANVLEDWGRYWNIEQHSKRRVSALERALRALGGEGTTEREGGCDLEQALRLLPSEPCRGETSLFRFRCFGNRNLHLEFKDLELLARFNQAAGGTQLRRRA